jgi:hypothetical protein
MNRQSALKFALWMLRYPTRTIQGNKEEAHPEQTTAVNWLCVSKTLLKGS